MPGTQEQQLAANAKLIAPGITSRRQIAVTVTPQPAGHGIVFRLPATNTNESGYIDVPARADFVVNTLRNVTLGIGSTRLCLVEHFLCATALWGLTDILVEVDGPELPLGDGSAKLWLEMFQEAGWPKQAVVAQRTLKQPITCRKGDRVLMAVPDEMFSATYMIDWNHPMIGRSWYTWDAQQSVEDLCDARTFGSLQEHQMLGIADDVVSLTADGFSHPLRFPDEPVRHKVLDVVGDLMLAGVNPLSWKARFISIKGGHELDVQMAKALLASLSDQ
jgi:UDP-3-O-[3-hydroxymyristoyl] N-acetylglucosamine deacetylase